MGSDLMAFQPEDTADMRNITKIDPSNVVGRIIALYGNLGLALVKLERLPKLGRFILHRPNPEGDARLIVGKASIPDWWMKNSQFCSQ